MSYKIYRTKQIQTIQQRLIPIIDGTGSMGHEYDLIVSSLTEVLSDWKGGMDEFQYQFSEGQVHPLIPFQNGFYGNLTAALKDVFETLLINIEKLPKSLTILFISDGQEVLKLKELSQQIDKIKQHFSISCICLAVGSQFPQDTIKSLTQSLHNQAENLLQTFFIERNSQRSQAEVKREIKQKFLEIKNLLHLQQGMIKLKQDVKQTIISKPQRLIVPNSVFYIEDQIEVFYDDGIKLEPSKNQDDVAHLIISSVEQALLEFNYQNFQQMMIDLQKAISKILEYTQIKQGDASNNLQKKFIDVLELVDNIAQGNLDINQLTNNQQTQILIALKSEDKSLKEEFIKYVENIRNVQDLNQEILLNRINEKYKQIKDGSFSKGVNQVQLSILEQAYITIMQTLQNLLQVIENDAQVNIIELLTEFKNQTFKSLNKVFEDSEFKVDSDQLINLLKQINDIFEFIHRVTEKQITPQKFIQTIKAKLKAQNENNIQEIVESAAIFNYNADFNFLPKELKNLIKEIDQELKKIFILLVDQNESMQKQGESNIAIERFQQKFKDIPNNQKTIITWQEKKFQIFENNGQDQQKRNRFNTLFQCLEYLENQLDLKNSTILMCLVSDGETEYQTLHREFKVAKFHYSIQFIYLALGRKLFAKIENELRQKFANRNVKGAPELINIPRALNQSTNINQKLGDQFSQKFENLVKKLVD